MVNEVENENKRRKGDQPVALINSNRFFIIKGVCEFKDGAHIEPKYFT